MNKTTTRQNKTENRYIYKILFLSLPMRLRTTSFYSIIAIMSCGYNTFLICDYHANDFIRKTIRKTMCHYNENGNVKNYNKLRNNAQIHMRQNDLFTHYKSIINCYFFIKFRRKNVIFEALTILKR